MNRNAIDEIGALLVKNDLIDFVDLQALHREFTGRSNITFEDFLLEEGLIDRDDLLKVLSDYYQVPYLDAVGTFFDHYLVRLVPKGVLQRHLMIPYQGEGDNLWVLAAEPDDPHLPVILGQFLDHNFLFMVGLPQDIRDAIQEYYDESDTYQPQDIANQQMERSAQEVHTPDELDERIPLIIEKTVDDYESK